MKINHKQQFTIESPIRVSIPGRRNKWFYLNLNQYRNAHWSKLNVAKKVYKDLMILRLFELNAHRMRFKEIELHYQIIICDKKIFDSNNYYSIIDKFFQDVLTVKGIIADDNYTISKRTIFEPIGLGRGLKETICEITVKEFKNAE